MHVIYWCKQYIYGDMQYIYVDMQYIYVHMQFVYDNMQTINLHIFCMLTNNFPTQVLFILTW